MTIYMIWLNGVDKIYEYEDTFNDPRFINIFLKIHSIAPFRSSFLYIFNWIYVSCHIITETLLLPEMS